MNTWKRLVAEGLKKLALDENGTRDMIEWRLAVGKDSKRGSMNT